MGSAFFPPFFAGVSPNQIFSPFSFSPRVVPGGVEANDFSQGGKSLTGPSYPLIEIPHVPS